MLAKIFYVRDNESQAQGATFDYETPWRDAAEAMAEIYRQFNRVDGNEEISKKYPEVRSLSVGDTVYFPEWKAWYIYDLAGVRQVRLAFVKVYLKTVIFGDLSLGLDHLLDSRPDLKSLHG
jgi:hypothetical protein